MGEYIYLDNNHQRKKTAYSWCAKYNVLRKPAKKMQSNQSAINLINKSESKNIYMNHIMFNTGTFFFLFTGLHLWCFG